MLLSSKPRCVVVTFFLCNAGEALFVDDIPSPKDCLHGAFIYSSKPLAHVKKIELSTFSEFKGSLALVSVKDIPERGQNIGSQSIFGSEPLFADVITEFVGQPLAVVVLSSSPYQKLFLTSILLRNWI